MRNNLKEKSFLNWRKRVDNRKTKHNALSDYDKKRFKSKSQRQISLDYKYMKNWISSPKKEISLPSNYVDSLENFKDKVDVFYIYPTSHLMVTSSGQ